MSFFNKVTNHNSVYVTVEDTENKMKTIQEKIKEVTYTYEKFLE